MSRNAIASGWFAWLTGASAQRLLLGWDAHGPGPMLRGLSLADEPECVSIRLVCLG